MSTCNCGRKIVIKIRGKWKIPRDRHHRLCRQCYRAHRDATRHIA